MALEELRRNIERDSKVEATALEEEAERESERIIKEAKIGADIVKKKAQEDSEMEVELRKKDVLTSLETESDSIISSAKEEHIDDAMEQFAAAIRKKLGARQEEIIKSAMKRFAEIIPPEQTVIKISKENAALLKSTKAKVQYGDIDGILLSSLDGKVKADATVDGLISSNMDAIRRILSKGLYG